MVEKPSTERKAFLLATKGKLAFQVEAGKKVHGHGASGFVAHLRNLSAANNPSVDFARIKYPVRIITPGCHSEHLEVLVFDKKVK